MKSQVMLLSEIISDEMLPLGYSPKMDIIQLEHRYKKEGMSFLTIALPNLEKSLLAGLEEGQFFSPPGWKKRGELPLFLLDLWSLVFDVDSGYVLTNPNPVAIRALRQILLFNKKPKVLCSADKVEREFEKFIQTDMDLARFTLPPDRHLPLLPVVMSTLFKWVINDVLKAHNDGTLEFKHSGGAVADRKDPIGKWDFDAIPDRQVDKFGFDSFFPLWGYQAEPLNQSIPARLIAIPKTDSAPRLIAAEPAYNQYIQQGIHTVLKHSLKIRGLACSYLTQEYNQTMACLGSVDGSVATIDLSEASDRVSLDLVRHAFSFSPKFVELLMSSRSEFIEVGGKLHLLRKFASMGSSETFPVEGMIFLGVAVYAICHSLNDFSPRTIRKYGLRKSGRVSVYGDDIIVPTEMYSPVTYFLSLAGLKVNENKSFYKGRFRESCGTDWYDGVLVTPIYLRYPMDGDKGSERLLSFLATRNALYLRGHFPRSVQFLTRYITENWPATRDCLVPTEFSESSGFYTVEPPHRWSKDLQCPVYKTVHIKYLYDRPSEGANDRQRLCFYLSRVGSEEGNSYGRPRASKIYSRWAAVG